MLCASRLRAQTLAPIAIHQMGGLKVPFHAHGIVCAKGELNCFTNP